MTKQLHMARLPATRTDLRPDGSIDITYLPTGDRMNVLACQFPEGLREKIYFMLFEPVDSEEEEARTGREPELWAQAVDFSGRVVFAARLIDEPMMFDGLHLVVHRAKVSDEFIAGVALML